LNTDLPIDFIYPKSWIIFQRISTLKPGDTLNTVFRVILMLSNMDYYNVLRIKVVVKSERFMAKRSYPKGC